MLKAIDKNIADEVGGETMDFETYHGGVLQALRQADPQVYELVQREYERVQNTLQLIAAENLCSRAVLAALGSVVQNKTTEGFAGARFHGGCEVVDDIEVLACERAKEAFGAKYANVQPHSGTSANQIVMTAILDKSDRILSLGMDQGGHVSHGATASFAGKFFQTEHYFVDRQSLLLDYDQIRDKARAFRPRLMICGGSAYCRTIDFSKFRQIADDVGAYVMADISHIAGLVMAGAHPSSIDYAHFTTTSTYKPGGPRGGLILMGRDYEQQVTVGGKGTTLWKAVERMTFPGMQGTPYLNNIAGKAVFFKETVSQEYRQRQFRIIENAQRLAGELMRLGYDVLTGGTDTHMVLVNVANSRAGLSGVISQKALERCGIIVNMNWLPYDTKSRAITSGMRLGTPIVTRNGMGPEQMGQIAGLVDGALNCVEGHGDRDYGINESAADGVRAEVTALCRQFTMR
jgi:glycine hydroxymethyltransferase